MKKVNYSDFCEKVKKKGFFAVRKIDRHAPRRRPRDPDEAEILIIMAKLSWDKAIDSGKLQKKGRRHYRLYINE